MKSAIWFCVLENLLCKWQTVFTKIPRIALTHNSTVLNQVDLIAENTKFNDVALLDGTFSGVAIQAGNTTAETISLSFADLGQTGLSINGASIATQASATTVIGTMDAALQTISQEQANFGSYQNRLNYSISNLSRASVMTEQALGRIMDADFARRVD